MISYSEIGGLKFTNILAVDLAPGTSYTMYPRDTGVYGKKVFELVLTIMFWNQFSKKINV